MLEGGGEVIVCSRLKERIVCKRPQHLRRIHTIASQEMELLFSIFLLKITSCHVPLRAMILQDTAILLHNSGFDASQLH